MDLNFLQCYNLYKSLDLDDPETISDVRLINSLNKHLKGDIIIHTVLASYTKTVYRVRFKNEQIRTWFQLKYPMVNT